MISLPSLNPNEFQFSRCVRGVRHKIIIIIIISIIIIVIIILILIYFICQRLLYRDVESVGKLLGVGMLLIAVVVQKNIIKIVLHRMLQIPKITFINCIDCEFVLAALIQKKTTHIPASNLNDRFQLDLTTKEIEYDDLHDIYYNENSRDRYFDIEDTDALFAENHQNKFFCMCINIRGLNIIKNFIGLVALIESLPKKPHVIAINETFTRENEEGHLTIWMDTSIFLIVEKATSVAELRYTSKLE